MRRWAAAALAGLTAARAELDALNVYPVADSDTGTNLVRTLQAGVDALAAEPAPDLETVGRTLADAVLRGACGNSGTIVSQLLRSVADAARGSAVLDAPAVAAALARGAVLARAALARPADGTILSVADAAAGAAQAVAREAQEAARAADGALLSRVVAAAHQEARRALAETPHQLAALGGRVDAGGRGLVVLLAALEAVVCGPAHAAATAPDDPPRAACDPVRPSPETGPTHEVMYLLDCPPDAGEGERVAELREALDRLGDSVLVVGGHGLWRVHAHVRDVGAAVHAGLAVGRPQDVRITALDGRPAGPEAGGPPREPDPGRLGVLALVEGAGLTDLLARAGAGVVSPDAAEAEVAAAVAARPEPVVAVLAGSPQSLVTAAQLAEGDPRVRTLRTRSAVQVVAAVAVHDPAREAGLDLLQMATAAAGCRDGLVEVAEGDGLTSAGLCRAGDVLGHVDGDVAVIGREVEEVALRVVDLLLGGGGELVTLVSGAPADPGLDARVAAGVRRRRPDVAVTTYAGGQRASYLLVGVE